MPQDGGASTWGRAAGHVHSLALGTEFSTLPIAFLKVKNKSHTPRHVSDTAWAAY